MILKFIHQTNLFDHYARHKLGQQLKIISDELDKHPEILEAVNKDLIRVDRKKTGRCGLSIESVIRCGILKQYYQWSYDELSFHIEDSQSCTTFIRLGKFYPKRSVLQKTITLIRAETWELMNRILILEAQKKILRKVNKSE